MILPVLVRYQTINGNRRKVGWRRNHSSSSSSSDRKILRHHIIFRVAALHIIAGTNQLPVGSSANHNQPALAFLRCFVNFMGISA
jgi:hypothetical protein